MNFLKLFDLGEGVAFWEAFELQKLLQNNLIANCFSERLKGFVIFCEHLPVYTIGNKKNEKNLLITIKELKNLNIELCNVNRGGDITYHGPGQLLVYFLLKISFFFKDLHQYLRILEQIVIDSLKTYNLVPQTKKELTGVWISEKKICSIGIGVKKWVSIHGVAVNINTDIKYFDNIIACGIKDVKMTSLAEETKRKILLIDYKSRLLESISKILSIKILN